MFNFFEQKPKKFIILLFLILIFSVCINVCLYKNASAANIIDDLSSIGKFSGTIGNYFEFTSSEANDSDYGWSTGYVTLKYETKPWNGFKIGSR